MVYKSSFGRGFNSGFLNSYVLSLFLCVFFSTIFIILSITNNPFLISIRYNTITISKPFFIIVGKPFELINDFVIYFEEVRDAKQENIKLLEENDSLKKQLSESNYLIIENHRLKNLLKINAVDYVKKITARILIDAYKDDGSIIYIDVGESNGLKINDIVFNEKGLLGRVSELGKHSSKILTIFDENSIIPVISVETKKSFFVKGGENKLSLKHIDKKFKLKHGEIIVSTDAAGYFKEGVMIGRVFKTLNEVFVIPFAKKSDSIYVNVLVYDFKNKFKD